MLCLPTDPPPPYKTHRIKMMVLGVDGGPDPWTPRPVTGLVASLLLGDGSPSFLMHLQHLVKIGTVRFFKTSNHPAFGFAAEIAVILNVHEFGNVG
jgi:hypothetical protein